MWKILIFSSFCVTVFAGIIHDHHNEHEEHHFEPKDTDHHHKVEHEHATSHQSFKIHHYHAVPVYVKKEDQHFLKHPIEVSGIKHELKLLHPETEKTHGHGVVLENHTEEHDNYHHDSEKEHGEHHEYQPLEHYHDFSNAGEHHDEYGGDDHKEFSHHQFHDINVQHGHHE